MGRVIVKDAQLDASWLTSQESVPTAAPVQVKASPNSEAWLRSMVEEVITEVPVIVPAFIMVVTLLCMKFSLLGVKIGLHRGSWLHF